MVEACKSVASLKAGPYPGLGQQHEHRDSHSTPAPAPSPKITSPACASHTGLAPNVENLPAASSRCILTCQVLSRVSPWPALSPHCHCSRIRFSSRGSGSIPAPLLHSQQPRALPVAALCRWRRDGVRATSRPAPLPTQGSPGLERTRFYFIHNCSLQKQERRARPGASSSWGEHQPSLPHRSGARGPVVGEEAVGAAPGREDGGQPRRPLRRQGPCGGAAEGCGRLTARRACRGCACGTRRSPRPPAPAARQSPLSAAPQRPRTPRGDSAILCLPPPPAPLPPPASTPQPASAPGPAARPARPSPASPPSKCRPQSSFRRRRRPRPAASGWPLEAAGQGGGQGAIMRVGRKQGTGGRSPPIPAAKGANATLAQCLVLIPPFLQSHLSLLPPWVCLVSPAPVGFGVVPLQGAQMRASQGLQGSQCKREGHIQPQAGARRHLLLSHRLDSTLPSPCSPLAYPQGPPRPKPSAETPQCRPPGTLLGHLVSASGMCQ